MSLVRTTSAAVFSLLAAASTISAARAECYDVYGCSDRDRFSAQMDTLASVAIGPKCSFLWLMRNTIYKEHGYCFKTARGRSELGNQGCSIDDIAAVPLSAIERANIATIIRAEKLKGCSG